MAHARRKTRSHPGDSEDYPPLENPESLVTFRNLRERQYTHSTTIPIISPEFPRYGLENPNLQYIYTNSPDSQ